METFLFKARFARRMPDPVVPGAQRHIFMCAVEDVPKDLPKDANPREQNIYRHIYRDIAKHLLNEEGTPNTFHLKNKGITILADEVTQVGDNSYQVIFSDHGQGIVDGAHTYEILLKHQEDIAAANSNGLPLVTQFVKFEIITGIARGLVPEIAGGLNTSMQVQQMSLAHLSKEFKWIEEELSKEAYIGDIAFLANEEGIYDIRDVLVILDLFNVHDFPNDGSKYPIRAYTSKESVLKIYRSQPANFENLRPILKDILKLHDIINSESRDLYNEGGGRRGGRLKFVEGPAKRSQYRFPFIGQTGDYRLYRGALFPMLGAFRSMVDRDPVTGICSWRGGFQAVHALWE